MTNILLSIIAVLLFARIVLQIRQGKRAVEKGYAAPSEVENAIVFCENNNVNYVEVIKNYNKCGYELVQMLPDVTLTESPAHCFFSPERKSKPTTTDYGRQRYRQIVRKSRNTDLRPEWRNDSTRQGCGV